MSELLPLLTAGTGLSESDVIRIATNAPLRYKTYEISKRNGGTRLISQPARELKALQRVLTSEFLCTLPVHESAMAYREGISIRQNALAHAKNGPIFKFDFEEFFPSIRATDWAAYCEKENLLRQPRDKWLSTNILFYRRSGHFKARYPTKNSPRQNAFSSLNPAFCNASRSSDSVQVVICPCSARSLSRICSGVNPALRL
jgi:RNA-directed DNA polymerase